MLAARHQPETIEPLTDLDDFDTIVVLEFDSLPEPLVGAYWMG